MNSDPKEFDTLRKLMALKRHEQPPREYLDELSHSIRMRIERGEGRANIWDKLSAHFSLRPSLAYAFGLTVCGALSFSAFYMGKQEMTEAADSSGSGTFRAVPVSAFPSQVQPVTPLHVANWLRNTNPSVESQPQLSLFNTSRQVVPVSYQTGY
jgi:hypothetical protein